LFIFGAAAAHADIEATVDDSPETVVVTATRMPTPELQVASSITVISARDIEERQIRTLPDLLQQVPGLNVVQTGGPGGQTSVFMRGTNSNHTKVLVDGIDVSDPTSGLFDFGTFLTQDIEKVEILRGPQSGLYGSDAIGGVINVITRGGSGPARFAASAESGSFDTFNQAGSISGSDGALHYAATLEHVHSGATPVTPLALLAPGERRIDDADDNLTASTKLGLDVGSGVDLGLVARYTDTTLRLTGDNFATFPATPDASQSRNDTRQYYGRGFLHTVAMDGAFEQWLGAAYGDSKSYDLSPDNPEADYFGKRVKFDWQGIARPGTGQKLLLGAEHQEDRIDVPLSAATTTNAGYVELQSEFGGALFDTVSARYDHNDRFGGEWTYRLAPAYLVGGSGTKLKASIGTGFKAPTLDQLYQNFPEFGFFANPDLKPERSVGYDVGFEQPLGTQLRFGATWYHNDITNLISDNADFSSYANVGRAVTKGVEAFMAYQPQRDLTLRLDYTFTQATDDILHQDLIRRPRHKIDLNGEWRASERVSMNAAIRSSGSWIDGNRDFSIPRLRAPGYTVVNLAASVDLTSHWSVFGRSDNLLDRRYQDPIGFQQPTIGAFAGIRARF
jgi:vitamin B12 transporter